MGRRLCGLALAGLAILAAPAAAQPADPALKGLAECAGVADPAAKGACYDAAYQALEQQVRTGELSIIRRKEAQEAQRGAFGLDLPSLSLFDRAAGGEGPLERVTDELARAYQDGGGRWVFELKSGATWRQIDNEAIAPRPKAGAAVEVRKAALGSFFLKVGEARGVRAKRSE
ncbi:hypothetical protein [Phenylobacterium sp.]|uniref:hypothetical protein n=1 Tax=Phenylobacterium sp. TaxID=1871053 RepID=UPI002810ECD9|nr:hypothetical protein [Phenylobacterium sp.]